jgi:hypothetical protein
MIVRDQGDSWQVVAQPDHGDVCGEIARAWGNELFAAPAARDSLVVAARRHDDGWAIWERTPDVDRRTGDGRPLNVFDIGVDVHLSFFRSMILAVSGEDEYAGVLASMHAVGLYSQRMGTDPALKLTMQETRRAEIDAFMGDLVAAHDAKTQELAVSEEQRWVDYKLLQVADRLCLYFCLNDLVAGTPAELAPAPRNYDGDDVTLKITPAGPWELRMDPYPFADPVAEFVLPRRVFPKRAWSTRAEFAQAYHDADVHDQVITIRAGA